MTDRTDADLNRLAGFCQLGRDRERLLILQCFRPVNTTLVFEQFPG